MALLGRQRTVRIDRDQLRAVALGLLRAAPQVQVRGDRVRAPEHDQLRILELLDVGAVARAERCIQRLAARGRADRAVEEARAELVEEALRHRLALHHAHRAGVAVRHDALRIDARDRLQACRDFVERRVPADALEATLALAADALQRMQQPVRVVGALEVAADLGAERARGRRMRRIARDLDRDTPAALTLHRDQHRAGVRAVVRAGRTHDFEVRVGLGHRSRSAADGRRSAVRRIARRRRPVRA